MMVFAVRTVHFIMPRARSHVRLTTEDGFDPLALGGFVKLDQPVHHAVIRYRNGGLSEFFDTF